MAKSRWRILAERYIDTHITADSVWTSVPVTDPQREALTRDVTNRIETIDRIIVAALNTRE